MKLKMYPSRDFKYLIRVPEIPNEVLINALRREPFPELLRYWSDNEKPFRLIEVYQIGIEEAVAKNRYPLYQLEDVKLYPEFIPSVLNGLKRLWTSLRFSLKSNTLLIDSINGNTLDISPENKLRILEMVPEDCIMSEHANKMYKLVSSLTE